MNYTIEDFKNIDFNEIDEQEEQIIEFCKTLKTPQEIMTHLDIDEDIELFQDTLNDMVEDGYLIPRYPSDEDKNHPKQKYKKNKGTKEETKQTKRVLELINRFNDGQKVCIDQLMEDAKEAHNHSGSEVDKLWFNDSTGKPMSEKSIRRDLDIVKYHFPRAFDLSGEKGCYKSLNKKMFDNFLNPKALSLMIQTFNIAQRNNMFDSLDINQEDKNALNKKARQINNVYEFKNRPFETKESDTELFHILEENIKNKKSLFLMYEQTANKIIEIEIKPYKILFMNDNFYLACAVDNEYMYSLYRISKIKNIKELGKKFNTDKEIEQFIKDIQTPFSRYAQDYQSNLIEITVQVDKAKAYFFKAKKYLSSQNIIDEDEKGNIIVQYTVTQEKEMEDLIKRWLPHIKVLEPLSLQKSIDDELKEYLNLV